MPEQQQLIGETWEGLSNCVSLGGRNTDNITSFTKNQEDEVSKGKRYEVVVHGRVEALAASDDDANKEVADDSAEEDDHVEDGHQHKTHLDMLTYGQNDSLTQ